MDTIAQPMIAPLARFLDWSAIQFVALMKPDNVTDPRLEEAIQFLKSPAFAPAESPPAEVELDGSSRFHFPTPQPCDIAENNIVHGRLYRCPGHWQQRPAIILLHGWGDSANYRVRFPLIARRCNRAGINAATLVAPYHFQRRPRQRGTFDGGDCVLWAKRAAQAIAEIRAMTRWLLNEGCPAVALWGVSMGAVHAGMTACLDARPAGVVMASPAVRCNPWVEQRAVRRRICARLPIVRELCEKMNQTAMDLTTTRPAIPTERILLVEGMHDLICPREDVEDLWQSWGQPNIWRLPHGHVSICCGGVPGLTGKVLRWLTPRMHSRQPSC
jgi:pimeloyl-ACP methyl ester carboxylesterase